MTIHSKVSYQCKFCCTNFVPIPEAPNCPRCQEIADGIFVDFVADTICSAKFNLSNYHSFYPGAWYVGTLGDHYYMMAFFFLDYVCGELKARKRNLLSRKFSETQVDALASQFLTAKGFPE